MGVERGVSCSAEVYKWLNFGTKLEIGKTLMIYANQLDMATNKKWRTVQSSPLQKEANPTKGADFRWIGTLE